MAARIPAILNGASGTAEEARKALEQNDAFEVHDVQPEQIAPTIRSVVDAGARRILVSGGDGTIATAATELLDAPTELAILPGGTLNVRKGKALISIDLRMQNDYERKAQAIAEKVLAKI